ncbi:TldD/PmbA family protein [Sphingomonas sp. HDW15A]|uniref:TldD/PmbA family protein n=1 Tax=Sphingomonas sp. HDW15A TaxID=2714942 RepID=UPI00140DDA08|nr:metallopeptidase TldD-related protein [Sphingomonas sp. HDW15A]QIK96646.1 TldD/PmbA family protein [Sphingomonas sp. HDW15A]
MRDQQQTRDLVEQAVELAMQAGANAADAVFSASRSSAVQVRMGALEDVHRSEAEAVGVRVFAGQRSATVSTSAFDPDSLAELVTLAIEMARQAPEDPFSGLAPSDLLAKPPFAEFDDWDPIEPEPKVLQEMVLEAEGAALAVAGVTNSSGCGTSSGASIRGIATSGGFSGVSRSTTHSLSASIVAGEGAGMQRDYEWHSARRAADLEYPHALGRKAGERAVARLHPIKVKPGPMAVLFEPRVSTGLLGHFAQAIAGSAIARKSSFLQERMGQQIFGPAINIIDDPFRLRGLRSRAFDAEGVTVRRLALVENGVLMSWIAETASARQLGIAPTGHAVRGISGAPGSGPSNLFLEAGERSVEQMIASEPRLLVLTELIGQGVNPVTGDYSRGASGFLYENGERVGAVSEITVASNLIEMFATLEPASDLEFRRGIDAPSILVPEMMVGSA